METETKGPLPSAENPELSKVFSLKPGVGQSIALHASPTAGHESCRSNFCLPSYFGFKVSCRDKKISRQTSFCRDKHAFVAKNYVFCRGKHLWQLPPMIDLNPFTSEPSLLRLVSAGHEVESEVGLSFLHNQTSLSVW